MEDNIIDLINITAKLEKNGGSPDIIEDLKFAIKEIIDGFRSTINCPSNWRYIGEKLLKLYEYNFDIKESYRLYEYEEEEL